MPTKITVVKWLCDHCASIFDQEHEAICHEREHDTPKKASCESPEQMFAQLLARYKTVEAAVAELHRYERRANASASSIRSNGGSVTAESAAENIDDGDHEEIDSDAKPSVMNGHHNGSMEGHEVNGDDAIQFDSVALALKEDDSIDPLDAGMTNARVTISLHLQHSRSSHSTRPT